MIDINHILQWKQEYGDIYQMELLNQHFIFRALGREEYKQIVLMDLSLGEFQEAICVNAVIYPENYDYGNGIAGIAEVISDNVLDVSGLHIGQAKQLLDQFREEMLNYDYQVDCTIHEAFPEYTLEEISTWPVRKTMFYLSRAEWILQELKGVPLQYIEEGMQQGQAQQQQPQPEQQPPPPDPEPFKREIRKELIEGPEEQPKKQETPEGSNQQPQTEEEVLAMLAGTGKNVSAPITDFEEMPKPELNWFKHMDELKGEFD